MAKPRVFLSSTFYDLRYVRSDIERFIRDLGYDPVLNELGHIPYGKTESLEQYCYREINMCDILVHIIGGKFGSASQEEPFSISQMELKTAHELNKQIYVFVERPVHVEYRTYLMNEDNSSFRPQYVDNIKIYQFLKLIYGLPSNNVIKDFDSISEIFTYLREQWAGLFQRFLQEESRREDYKISSNLKSTSETLASIIEHVTRERDETIKSILIHNHPIFSQIAEATNIEIRIFFLNYREMNTLLKTFGYVRINPRRGDSMEYENGKRSEKLVIVKDVFDEEGNLKPVEQGQWERKFLTVEDMGVSDSDIPF